MVLKPSESGIVVAVVVAVVVGDVVVVAVVGERRLVLRQRPVARPWWGAEGRRLGSVPACKV